MTAATPFSRQPAPALGVSRCAVTAGLTVAIVFALCWAGAAAGLLPRSHMFISLFTEQPVDSGAALGFGLLAAVGSGLGSGAIWALIYNALAFLQRPSGSAVRPG